MAISKQGPHCRCLLTQQSQLIGIIGFICIVVEESLTGTGEKTGAVSTTHIQQSDRILTILQDSLQPSIPVQCCVDGVAGKQTKETILKPTFSQKHSPRDRIRPNTVLSLSIIVQFQRLVLNWRWHSLIDRLAPSAIAPITSRRVSHNFCCLGILEMSGMRWQL